MYKYKKLAIRFITLLFIIFSLIELIYYLFTSFNTFGLIYIISSLLIIFLLVPLMYNYNKYYSVPRISKLIIVIILGIFTSFILKGIVLNSISYIDASNIYSNKIFVIKNILKPIIYALLIIFTAFEFKSDTVINKRIYKKK